MVLLKNTNVLYVQFGYQYVHCDKCHRCVKPTWSHCSACGTCELPGRHTTSLQSTGYVFISYFASGCCIVIFKNIYQSRAIVRIFQISLLILPYYYLLILSVHDIIQILRSLKLSRYQYYFLCSDNNQYSFKLIILMLKIDCIVDNLFHLFLFSNLCTVLPQRF